MNTILVDVDGVLADFYLPAVRWHLGNLWDPDGNKEDAASWPRGTWDIAKNLGISEEEFWRRVDTSDFWDSLPVYPGAELFLQYLKVLTGDSIVLCTRASPGFVFPSSRKTWVHTKLGPEWPLVVMCDASKSLLARKDVMLLDDHPETIRSFLDTGGLGILVERPWNCEDAGLWYGRVDYPALLREVLSVREEHWCHA